MNWNAYFQCRLALIDMEIDNRIHLKKTVDYELTRLYELRENIVAELQDSKECNCKKKEEK